MSATLTIALGYRELNSVPKVLYIGDDADAAQSAINVAGNAGKISDGHIIRHLDGNVMYRHHFEPTRELVAVH
jgi:hypothetical protein